jgi:uncharacterized protein YqjF (DUF2071 family)
MAMQWDQLLFMHWPVAAHHLRRLIPPALQLDTRDGAAWVGVVPFTMRGVRARLSPALPGMRSFPELNVRTYVTHGGKPGVWFFSLDAANPLAVEGARSVFHLNYYNARMSARQEGDTVIYRSARTHRGAPPAAFAGRYRPAGAGYRAEAGSFDAWLTERYCLYAGDQRGRIWRGDIHHAPWTLHPAEAEIAVNTMTAQIGLDLAGRRPLLHYASPLPVVAWAPTRVV